MNKVEPTVYSILLQILQKQLYFFKLLAGDWTQSFFFPFIPFSHLTTKVVFFWHWLLFKRDWKYWFKRFIAFFCINLRARQDGDLRDWPPNTIPQWWCLFYWNTLPFPFFPTFLFPSFHHFWTCMVGDKELSKPKLVNGTSSIFNGIYSLFVAKVMEPSIFWFQNKKYFETRKVQIKEGFSRFLSYLIHFFTFIHNSLFSFLLYYVYNAIKLKIRMKKKQK